MPVLVVVEHRRGGLEETSLEPLAKGREVARAANGALKAVVMGDDAGVVKTVAALPVDEVLTVAHEALHAYTPEGYGAALRALIQEEEPILVMASHTATGYEYLPRTAADLGKPVVTDAVDVTMEDGALRVTRMGYNGKVAVEMAVEAPDPCFVTLRPGAAKAPAPGADEASVREVGVDLSDVAIQREVLGYEKPATEDIDIAEADVIVAAGRGIKEQENLRLVEELAQALGGVVAGSRPLIDKEWLPWSRQVGSSGKTVRPKLYIACGISGAMQHVTGMKGAQTIVAINVDPTAPIFGVAHYGVVGDLFKVIPVLVKELKGA